VKPEHLEEVSIHISRSSMTTEVNKTGSWRFVRPKYEEKTAPCSAACPAGEDIARIEMLAGQGLLRAAVETILLENPFPAVCGRVCFHPCEAACNRAEMDEAIAIHRLERFLGDAAVEEDWKISLDKLPENGKKVCVVGSGPAGLASGYFLTRLGYSCDIFEAQAEPGGRLRWGIPEYRLPQSVLKSEIDRIEILGVKIHGNTPVTPAFLKDAKNRYDAVFMGCGLGRSLQMGIIGEELASDGLGFLDALRRGQTSAVRGTAAVIGGGNTAIDVARTLVRLGAQVVLVYRRRIQDMPAFASEVAMAVEEGVEIMELAAPTKLAAEGRELVITLQKMKISGMQTSDHRARVIPRDAATRHLRVDKIFTAIGAEALEPWQRPPVKNTASLSLSHCTFAVKDLPLVFGGDLTNSLRSVTDAVASGKQAAMALDIFFQSGLDAVNAKLSGCRVGGGPALSMARYMGGGRAVKNPHIVSYDEINNDYFEPAPRVAAPCLAVDNRTRSFAQVEGTLSHDQVLKETARCFNCGICNACDNCRIFCPEVAVTTTDIQRQINLDYCKGCGICVQECPRNAMALEEEI
jgi:NADPH-dependent glutamate synthase beta subunit-like oxidoreductase/ferredoxin